MMDAYQAGIGPSRLTRENHPENHPEKLPEPPVAAAKESTLLRTIAVTVLGGIIGMIYGVAALSSAFDDPASLLSLLPMVAMLVALEAGYWGAIVWMWNDEGGD